MSKMNLRIHCSIASLLLVTAACGTDDAAEAPVVSGDSVAAAPQELQALIQLPADFGPEGIAIGENNTFYVGSLAPGTRGQILSGNLATGEFTELVPSTGTVALGIQHDERSNLLFVAGGDSGQGFVYDAATGAEVASFEFAGDPAMINDVAVTDDAAYFTDSQLPALYRVALDAQGQPGEFSTVELPTSFNEAGSCSGAPPIKGNGIAATPDGRYLILIHMSEGALYRFDTESGDVQQIALSGGDVCSADGLLLDGNTLYAVQNMLSQVAVVELGPDMLTGNIVRTITEPFASNPATKIPTTIADGGDALYAVTAGFADPSPDYIVRVEK